MPFFQKSNHFQSSTLIKQIWNKPSLWAILPINLSFVISRTYSKKTCKDNPEKRVSSFISKKIVKGSMTLEMALVFPIFLFSVFSLISLISVMKIKSCMDVAVCEVGNEIAIKKYNEDISDILLPVYIKNQLEIFIEENLSQQDMKKLHSKIYVTDISLFEEDEIIAFRVDYNVIPDFHMLGLDKVNLNTIYYGHSWQGYSSSKEEETMVFLTENASVYHTDKNCTHMQLTIEEVSYDTLDICRNNKGSKYDECNFCNKISNNGTVYITPEGESYHNIISCAGLTRSIFTVPYSTILGKQKCIRCGENE